MKQVNDEEQNGPLLGYLLIHVAGYKRNIEHMVHIFSSGTEQVSVPDCLLKAELHSVGSPLWYEEGWAVGDNPRERFCKWDWVKAMRKFRDFDEAVGFIYRLRQKRKRANEEYRLVYVLNGVEGKKCSQPVSSLEDIASFENQVAEEIAQHRKELKSQKQALHSEYPEFEQLTKTFGHHKAFQLSTLLKVIRQDGKDKAMLATPKSTFYRNVQELKKLGLID